MMSVIHMQVWESERRLEEARRAAHRNRVCAQARAAQKTAQREPVGASAAQVVWNRGVILQAVRQALLAAVAGLPPSRVSWGW